MSGQRVHQGIVGRLGGCDGATTSLGTNTVEDGMDGKWEEMVVDEMVVVCVGLCGG